MRRYETVVIVDADLPEEERRPLFEKLQGIITDQGGRIIKFDEWGRKRLAYLIKKQSHGYYVLVDFCGPGTLVKELERNLLLDDRVLRFMTVLTDKEFDISSLEREEEQEDIKKEEVEEVTEEAIGDSDSMMGIKDTQPEKIEEELKDAD
nr:30S ribosomal protein S6 [Desulfobacterales bacterium]